jgi:hypothetical protein
VRPTASRRTCRHLTGSARRVPGRRVAPYDQGQCEGVDARALPAQRSSASGTPPRCAAVVGAVEHKLVFSEPKTNKERRSVALDPVTAGALRSHRAAQAAERLARGEGWTDSGLVFTNEDGTPTALAASVPAKVFIERLGRANIAIRLDTYSQVLPALQKDKAAKVAAFFIGGAS